MTFFTIKLSILDPIWISTKSDIVCQNQLQRQTYTTCSRERKLQRLGGACRSTLGMERTSSLEDVCLVPCWVCSLSLRGPYPAAMMASLEIPSRIVVPLPLSLSFFLSFPPSPSCFSPLIPSLTPSPTFAHSQVTHFCHFLTYTACECLNVCVWMRVRPRSARTYGEK